jgi:beta-glucosidase-like glycosyl hydrolase
MWPTTNFGMTIEAAMVNMINAGVDMIMLASTNPDFTIDKYQTLMYDATQYGGIQLIRIKDAVTRILGVKCVMGLIDGLSECKRAVNTPTYDSY